MIIKEMENSDCLLVESYDKTVACVMATRMTPRDGRGWEVKKVRIGVHPETHEEIWIPVKIPERRSPTVFPSMRIALLNAERKVKNLTIEI
jgi:hypothetical protein